MSQSSLEFRGNPRRDLNIAVLAFDICVAGCAFLIGLALRLRGDVVAQVNATEVVLGTLGFMAFAGLASVTLGLNRSLWRYTSIPDVLAILKTATIATAVMALLLFIVSRLSTVPRGSIVITWIVMVVVLAGARTGYRMWCLSRSRSLLRGEAAIERIPVAVFQADSDAELFIKSTHDRIHAGYEVVAVLDERNRRGGRVMRGVPIVSSLDQLSSLSERGALSGRAIKHLVLTKPRQTLRDGELDRLIEWGSAHRCSLLQSTELNKPDVKGRNVSVKPIKIEDLLGRPVANLASSDLDLRIGGRCVVITGAGGSIGSELCRTIAAFEPAKMVLIDLNDDHLHTIHQALKSSGASRTELVPILGDVRDGSQINAIFTAQRPDLVFHAAALKHVPIVELQPIAGLVTNVLGTRNVAQAASDAGAQAVVMISTDKAVNPGNVMGASKRMAELYCQALDVTGDTRFVTVRFGNVLGSSGSVVPLFEKQIRGGGPVTVTSAEMTRYFMTIPEAAQLVVHAMEAALQTNDHRGHIHVLDMGEPVQILALARKMIQLSGLRPNVDIDIKITGLRPGEKLFEELFSGDETRVSAGYDGVLVGTPLRASATKVIHLLDKLEQAIKDDDTTRALQILATAVPEATTDFSALARAITAAEPTDIASNRTKNPLASDAFQSNADGHGSDQNRQGKVIPLPRAAYRLN